MAATGKTPILLYGSTTATNQPSAGNLTNSSDGCEIAINVADKNLFFKDATNTVNTVPIRQSSASSNGWLSSTDWSTFNNKQPAGTYVTSVTGTAPVVSSGGTTPAISMAAATGSVNGYLTSIDWTTFNGKQAALVSGTNIKTVNGTSLLGSGDVGTIDVSHGGTGLTSVTAGYVPFGNSASALSTSNSLYWDNSNHRLYVGDGNAFAPQSQLDVRYAAGVVPAASGTTNTGSVRIGYPDASWGGVVMDIGYTTSSPYCGWIQTHAPTDFATSRPLCLNPSNGSGGGVTVGYVGEPGANNLGVAGNVVIATSGKGIDFSVTSQAAGMTSELLADYEEGTWTPIIGGTGGTSGQAYTAQRGLYTKVGRMVTCTFDVVLSTKGTITTEVMIGGLPYTALNSATARYPSCNIGLWQNLSTSYVYLNGVVIDNTTYAAIRGATAAATSLSSLATANISDTSRFSGTITYFTA